MSNAPLGLAVVCRKVQNSIIQVLLHKTGNSPYNQRSWAFPGGLMNQPNDNRVRIQSNNFIVIFLFARNHIYFYLLILLTQFG